MQHVLRTLILLEPFVRGRQREHGAAEVCVGTNDTSQVRTDTRVQIQLTTVRDRACSEHAYSRLHIHNVLNASIE
jgi:hypothetical protein